MTVISSFKLKYVENELSTYNFDLPLAISIGLIIFLFTHESQPNLGQKWIILISIVTLISLFLQKTP